MGFFLLSTRGGTSLKNSTTGPLDLLAHLTRFRLQVRAYELQSRLVLPLFSTTKVFDISSAAAAAFDGLSYLKRLQLVSDEVDRHLVNTIKILRSLRLHLDLLGQPRSLEGYTGRLVSCFDQKVIFLLTTQTTVPTTIAHLLRLFNSFKFCPNTTVTI